MQLSSCCSGEERRDEQCAALWTRTGRVGQGAKKLLGASRRRGQGVATALVGFSLRTLVLVGVEKPKQKIRQGEEREKLATERKRRAGLCERCNGKKKEGDVAAGLDPGGGCTTTERRRDRSNSGGVDGRATWAATQVHVERRTGLRRRRGQKEEAKKTRKRQNKRKRHND